MQPRLGDRRPDRLAEADHQRLLGLIHGEYRAVGQDQAHQNEDGNDAAGDTELHGVPPGRRN